MNFIINLVGKFIVLVNIEIKRAIGLIENDLGLIRYILKILRMYEASVNNGYIQFENKEGETYLHRVILEYYSNYDLKLYTVLKNADYEVNHKNKLRWDNRLENLEIVTKQGNILHKNGKEYEEEVIISSDEIIKIKEKINGAKNKGKNRKYLEKVSSKNINILCNEISCYGCNKNIFENSYIRFNNKIISTTKITSITININTLNIFSNIIFMNGKNTFFNNYISKSLIISYDTYRYNNIISNNFKLIKKYYYKSIYFRTILKKYNLLNSNYIKPINLERNILIDIFYYLLPKPLIFTFYKNELFISFSVKDLILTRGKYNSFKILYYTQLLKRHEMPFNKNNRTVTAFLVPKYTEDLFTSTVLPLAKKLYDFNLTKITHTILTKNDDLDVAQKVYKNSKLKHKTEKDLITIADIIDILSSITIQEKVSTLGFITVNDIRQELYSLNQKRKEAGLFYRDIVDSDNSFITSMIRNITEIKETMKDLSIEYTILTNKTKEKIRKYQIFQNGQDVTTNGLNFNQRIIVLKKLIVKNRKK